MDKLSAMATFVKVVETGSFTRAADTLGLPKARVSQRVSDLERALGVRLLHRTTRSLRPTEDGQAYFVRCQLVLQEIEELEESLKGGTREPRGRLHAEALTLVARTVLAPELPRFQAAYPQLQLRLGASDRVSNLLEDGLDCAIRGGELVDSSLISRHACDVHIGLYASPAYLAASPVLRHPRDLAQHRRLSWFAASRQPLAWELESGRRTHAVPATQGLLFDDPDAALAACLAGAGVCPGVPWAVAPLVRAGTLAAVLPAWQFPARPIHVIYPSRRHLSARVRTFVDWSMDLLRRSPGLGLRPVELG